MAKKKGTKKKTTRRRKVGAMSMNAKSPIVRIAVAAAGYFVSDQVNLQIAKMTGSADPKIVGGAELGLGALAMLKAKQPMLQLGGAFLAGVGLKASLKSFGVINGYGVNGYQKVPVIGGYQKVPVIGMAKRMNGYVPNPGAIQGNGYTVPRPLSIMGSADGSGLLSASGCME